MNLYRVPFWLVASALFLIAFVAIGGRYYYRLSHRVLWSVVHVSGVRHSGDAHLLEFPGGHHHVVLIDTGFEQYARSDLIPYLDERGIDHIDQLIITHAHRNHYGGIKSLLQHLKYIDRIYFNLPPESQCEREKWPGGCDYQDVLETRQFINGRASLRDLATGDVLYHDPERDITLEVVYVHDGISPPVGKTDINDATALLRLIYGSTTVFFTADLNWRLADYLLDDSFFLKSDIVTAPHHGVESAASNEFLSEVDPSMIIVSDSSLNWLGPRGDRMRQFIADHDIPTFVTGLDGNIRVSLTRDGYSVATARLPHLP